jgi:hypothetical protein
MGNQGKRVITESGLTLDYSAVTVDGILSPADALTNGVQTNKHRVQLRQEVRTVYPAARGNQLFNTSEFGPGKDFTEKRVTWLNVPSNTTIEEIQSRLSAMDCPTLVRTLGLKPVLSQDQIIAMEKGINTKSMTQYLESFVRTGENGEAVKFADRLQYRAIHFSDTFADDNDNRLADLKELQAAEIEIASSQANSSVQMSAGLPSRETAPATY